MACEALKVGVERLGASVDTFPYNVVDMSTWRLSTWLKLFSCRVGRTALPPAAASSSGLLAFSSTRCHRAITLPAEHVRCLACVQVANATPTLHCLPTMTMEGLFVLSHPRHAPSMAAAVTAAPCAVTCHGTCCRQVPCLSGAGPWSCGRRRRHGSPSLSV